MKHPSVMHILLALVALGGVASAGTPGERTDGQRRLGICQTLLGEGSSFCNVVTDWSVQKTVDVPLAEQPNRQGLAYTIRLIEGQTRYELGMTSVVTLAGLIPEGTQIRGIVVSLQRAQPLAEGHDSQETPLYTSIAGALVGDADPACGCPYVAPGGAGVAGDLTVTLRDELGNPIQQQEGVLIESLEYGEKVVVQLDAVYDLSAGIVLPGELVRIQACVQYAPSDEATVAGCFDDGGSVRSVRACSSFEFADYAKPDSARVTLSESMQLPSHEWIMPNGFKARSGSPLVTPTATLVPIVPGAEPVSFVVAASGLPNTETVVSVKGDMSCADIVDCGGAAVCSGTVTNTATLDFGDGRDPVSSLASTNVLCAAHRCTPAEVAGCDDRDPCTSDTCEIGFGCKHAPYDGPCDDGDACTQGEQCLAGVCTAGATIACGDDGNSCTAEQCDAVLGCVRTNLANRSDCEDGNPCTVDDLCMDGACRSGSVISCDDHNPCTIDSCKSNGACLNTPFDSGPGSCDDGNACTVGDRCDQGACVAGIGPTCQDDGNPCTVETCSPTLGCVTTTKANLAPCEDGNACTVGDQCVAGQCRPGAAPSCDDQNACTNDGCDRQLGCFNAPRAGACDDNTACTSSSSCQDGACKGTAQVDCNDDNPCTTDSCDPLLGCRHIDIDNGTGCDDGDACTTGETCQSGTCLASQLTQCDDHNACTSSTCVPGTGCVHVPQSGSCEDGDKCTGPDSCNAGVCVAGRAVSCDDNNPCTTDSCTPTQGCKHALTSGAACDDKDQCTGAGLCAAGVCQKGTRITCDDNNPCTSDQCDAVQGCVQIQITGSCDDGDACTGAGTCQLGTCVAGAPISCDDGNSCTADYCKAGTGCSTLPRSNVPCNDNDACTTNDTCQQGRCLGGAALDCNDNNVCTADSCGVNGCSNKPVSGGCSDGSLCTIGDTCVAGRCESGTPKVCADSDSCTIDSCMPETGACLNTRLASGSVCEDGEECTGCPWPEALVDRGFHGLDAKPDAGFFPNGVTASLELDQFIGAGTGKAWLSGASDLRWIVMPSGVAYLRGTVSVPVGGAMRTDSEAWKIEMAFTFRGVGRAGQGATPFYELPVGTQGSVWNDGWEYWTLATGAWMSRAQPTPDSATLTADPSLQSLPLQVGLRANGRNLGYGAAMPVKWQRGTRSGTGVLRLNLEREQCDQSDMCGAAGCVGGTVTTQCRDLLVGDYCTYTDADFGAACSAASPNSGACRLVQGFNAIANERTACSQTVKGVAFGHTGYKRWGFSSAPKIDAFLPTTALVSFTVDQCNAGPTTARPEVGRVFALSLSIALSDAGTLPAAGGVPLGELVRTSGVCAGLSIREIARRAEAIASGAAPGATTCADLATLDQEVTAINNGFRNCQGVMTGIGLPQ